MRVRGACMLAAALGTLAIGAGVAEAKGPLYGVVPQDGALPGTRDLNRMLVGGISEVRLMLHWGTIEQQQGVYNWGSTDITVRRATRKGIQPLYFLYGTPTWAAHTDGHPCRGGECSAYAPSSPATREAFARFAAAAVERYGPNGEFWAGPDPPCRCEVARPLRAWQIWNEQNSPKYFQPDPDVESYGRTLTAAAAAIKAVDPGADVILGGMWGPKWADEVMPVRTYLQRLYAIPGIAASFDSIAVHPYAPDVKRSLASVEAARAALRRAGDFGAGLWVTEIGWASDGPPDNPYVKSESRQGELLSGLLSGLRERRRTFRLRGVFWYSWRDKPGGGRICDWCGHAGLRARDGSPKPAWRAFTKVARG